MAKTILITGASSGLGEEMARQFADLGYDLALCARRMDKLETLKAGILAGHPDRRVELRRLDVTDDDQVFEVFRAFQSDFGTIDRIVINAGLGKGAKIGTGRYDANRQTAMTNFVAALAQSEAAMEIFRAQEDRPLRDDQLDVRRPRDASRPGDVRRHEGGRGPPDRGAARRVPRQTADVHRDLPRLHRLRDERQGRAGHSR